ncbi:hypothetical protein EGT67_16730 [Prescottella agglutinans]|uniref:Uncharacterized protein n=1 Tax=Prescottella agglutinans TaxID=1644129 RepID=A0A3S3AU47_9NOCA|nr:hypothetical protein EGT67_16730 [Prescottella agglutinans]
MVVAAVATVAVAGCATEVTGTPTARSGSAAATTGRNSDSATTDFTAWAGEYCRIAQSSAESSAAIDQIPTDDIFSGETVAELRKALTAGLPALDALIDLPAPPVADGKRIGSLLDATFRNLKQVSEDMIAVLDANRKGLDAAAAQEIADAYDRTDEGLSEADNARLEEFHRSIEDLRLPACAALVAGIP